MRLIIEKFGNSVQEIELREGQEYSLGREAGCDAVLECQAVISRKHLKIIQSEKQLWMLECVSPLGGLYMDGESIDAAEMEGEAVFSFYEYTFRFVEEKEESQPAPPAAQSAPEKPPVSEKEEKTHFSSATRAFAPQSLSYMLEISVDGEAPQYAPLSEGERWIVGRGEGSDIILDLKFLTKSHFEIFKQGLAFQIKDLGSSNGTFLNGKRLSANKPYPLKSQDIILAGGAKIAFKAKSAEMEKISQKASSEKEEGEEERESPLAPSLAMPKVLLEDIPQDEDSESPGGEGGLFNKKKALIYSSIALGLGALLLFHNQGNKKDKKALLAKQLAAAKTKEIESLYKIAAKLMSDKKYAFCVEQLEKLHDLVPSHRDSKALLIQCQSAVESVKRAEEMKEQEAAAREARETTQALVEKCEKQLPQFESVEELNSCLGEALDLDPSHAKITEMQNTILDREVMKNIEREAREAAAARFRGIKWLYTKARGLKDKGEPILKVERAYEKFISAAKGSSSLKELRETAKREIAGLRQNYNDTLERLHSSCESLIDSSRWKEAYADCLKILDFKSEDKKAVSLSIKAKEALENKMKPIYAKSALEESLSNTAKAKELWGQILSEDIKGGRYYQKAQAKLNKYK